MNGRVVIGTLDDLLSTFIVSVIDMCVGNRMRIYTRSYPQFLGKKTLKKCKSRHVSRETEEDIIGTDDVVEMKTSADDIHGECIGTGDVLLLCEREAV